MKLNLDRLKTMAGPAAGFAARACREGISRLATALVLFGALVSSSRGEAVQQLTGHVPAAAKHLSPIGRLPATQLMHIVIGLELRDRAGLEAFLAAAYDPKSPNYKHYLTPAEFTERYSATAGDYARVVAFAKAHHLVLDKPAANRMILTLSGKVVDVEAALHVTMRTYQHPHEARTFFAPDREPSLDLSVPVTCVSGLDNYVLPQPMIRRQPAVKPGVVVPSTGSGPGGYYMGNDFRAAYVPGSTLTGVGQSVALLQFDGYFPSDISAYETMAGLPAVPLQNILLDGFNGTPGANNIEVALDIEMCVSMAPSLTQILVYQGFIPESILNQIAVDDAANQASASWTWGGGPSTTIDQIMLEMAAQGQTFCHASGDFDAYPPGEVDDPNASGQPSDNPYMLQVGGTTLFTSGPGGSWVSETVWQAGANPGEPYGGSGSSGGISTYYTIPSWQAGVNMSTNGGSTTFRNLPDVALTADGIVIVADDGQVLPDIGGTSCASPLWAAFTALVNQQATENGQQPVGFLCPALYSIAKDTALYREAFHDTTTGNNTNAVSTNLFYAYPGYDLTTGWGTPAGTALINLLAPPTGGVPLLRYGGNYLLGGNGNGVIDPNECNTLLVVVTNYGIVNATAVSATLTTTTPGVFISQPTSLYPNIGTNSAATNQLAFRISTAPTFVCGEAVNFTLSILTGQSFNAARARFQLPSGTPATPLRYDNSTPVTLPSLGRVDSDVVVSNFPSALLKATVSVYAADAYDAGLEMELIGPDGTTNILVAGVGGAGQGFGVACAPDSSRTVFDDAAAGPVSAGVPPFVGSYQPQQALSAFIGRSGTNVNGVWKLRALDLYGFGGTVECWSLFLTPATCLDGGGECAGADMGITLAASPDPVIVGQNLTYTITVTNAGPSGVQDAVVTHLLPSGVILSTATPSQGGWTLAGGVITFDLGAMPARASATITVVAQAAIAGVYTSSATVSSETVDPNPLNNTAAVVDHIQSPTADLSVVVAASPATVLVGNTVTYTVTAQNNGPSFATGVVVTNYLPAGVAILSATVSQGALTTSGSQIVCNIGAMTNSQTAVAVIKVQVQQSGSLTESSHVSGDQYDPATANNSATTVVNAAATSDLAVAITQSPSPVVVGNNLTYHVAITNLGPSLDSGVLLTFALDQTMTLVSSTISQGVFGVNGHTLVANIGNLPGGATVQAVIKATAVVPGTVSSTASIVGANPDQNPANNTATAGAQVAYPFVSIVPAGFTLTSESFTPPSGIIYNGETVGVTLRLQNAGNVANTNLVATLIASPGITPAGANNAETFGVLAPSGPPVGRSFSFLASGAPGATLSAVLQVSDAGVFLTNVPFSFSLPNVLTFSNTAPIVIVDFSNSVPYPSQIIVSGVTGTLAKVTATLNNFGHTYPRDVDVLLVAPNGAETLLLSHAGNDVTTGAYLTFDDASTNTLPFWGALLTGTYHGTAYGSAPVFTNPAPAGPYLTSLSSLAGSTPNGAWSLYVEDDTREDSGGITNGWTLALTLANPINPQADLALTASGPANSVLPAGLTYNYVVSNNGPAAATFVVFSNALPAGLTFVSASSSQGEASLVGNAVIGNLGSLAVGRSATLSVTVAPSLVSPAVLTNQASVSASQDDVNSGNNTASVVTTFGVPAADIGITGTVGPNPVVAGFLFTNNIVVTNAGPGLALVTVVSTTLPANAEFVTATSTNGTWATNGAGSFTGSFGNLPANASAALSLVLLATTTNTSGLGTNPSIAYILAASTTSADARQANNFVTNVLPVSSPAALLQAAGSWLVSEHGVINGAVDIGDTVTVLLALTNAGTIDTSSNLTATLLPGGGVDPVGTATEAYGVITHAGGTVAQPFSFTATNSMGGSVVATLALKDVVALPGGGWLTNSYQVPFSFPLPVTSPALSNSAFITIPTFGPATPYPSLVTVTGTNGLVSKVTVTLHGVYHTFPSDIDAVVVNPSGLAVAIMANAGYSHGVSGLALTFDDAAAAPLPEFAVITSGTWQPTVYGALGTLPGGVPAAPYGTALQAFNGSPATGSWSLYIYDHKQGDSGGVTEGWSLDVTTVNPITPAAVSFGIQPVTGGRFQLALVGMPGVNYVIQSSTDLTNWTTVATPTATAVPYVLTVEPQAAGLSFFRAMTQP